MRYHQLTQAERYQIQAAIDLEMKLKDIALKLNRHRSTLFRELKRNGFFGKGGYSAIAAQIDDKAR